MRPARRLSLGLALVGLVPPLAVVASAGWLWQRLWTEQQRQIEERAVRALEGYLAEIRQELRGSLDVLIQQRQMENILVEMVRGTWDEKSSVHLARDWLEARGLDLLTLVDADGKVISCGHLPARFGENEPKLPRLAGVEGEKVFLHREAVLEKGSIRERLAVVALAQRSFESASVSLMAGLLLEGSRLTRMEEFLGTTLAVIDADGRLLLASGGKQEGDAWPAGDERQSSQVRLPPSLDEELGEARIVVDVRQEEMERQHLILLACMVGSAFVGWLLAWWLGWMGLRSIVARASSAQIGKDEKDHH